MRQDIIKIEEHLFEKENHNVKIEYRIFRHSNKGSYTIKTKSQLTKTEKVFGWEQHFHF